MAPGKVLGLRAGVLTFFAAFFLWFAGDSAVALYEASRAEAWPTVPGQITSSGVAKGCGRGGSYYPAVRYSYNFGGAGYEGERVTFGNVGCGSESLAQTIASAYPVNKSIRVYVNPSNPRDAVITTRVHEETKVGLLLTGALFLATAAWAFATFLQMRSNNTIERDAPQAARPSS